MCKAGRQQEINSRFTRLPRLFYCNFNDKTMTKKKKKRTKEKKRILSCHYRCNQAGITEDIPTAKQKFS